MGVHLNLASVFQAGKGVLVHSFPPIVRLKGQQRLQGYTLPLRLKGQQRVQLGVATLFSAIKGAAKSAGVHSFLPLPIVKLEGQ